MQFLIEYAIAYAKRGWPIFPLKPLKKIPLTVRGFKDATTDSRTIHEWWARWPDANIGLPTGKISGIGVIDIDPRHGGDESLAWIIEKHGEIPLTPSVRTGGLGRHYYFKFDGKLRNSANQIAQGIDTRGEGGYVVAPASTHESGNQYAWEDDSELLPLADLPAWASSTIMMSRLATGNLEFIAGIVKADGSPVPPGGRNIAAASLAGQYITAGDSIVEVMRKVRSWNSENPSPLPDSEIEKTVASVTHTHAKNNPATVIKVGDAVSVISETEIDVPHLIVESFPRALLEPPGIVGDMCKWVNDTAIKPQPILALANMLAFYGAVIGRKVRSPTDLRSNLYCLGVGASGCGKDHSRKCVKQVCESAGLTASILGGEDLSSDAAVFSAVYNHPSILFQLDEIGHFLANANSKYAASHQKNIAPTFTKMFSSANTTLIGKEYVGRDRIDIIQPNVCLYGTTVPERLYEGLTPGEVSDGFLGRMLVFRSDDSDPVETDQDCIIPPHESIASNVEAWFRRDDLPHARGNIASLREHIPHTAVFQPDAIGELSRFRSVCRKYKSDHRGQLGMDALWSRAAEHAIKVALVIACGCKFDAPAVDGQTMAWSIKLVNYLVGSLVATVSESIAGSDYERDLLLIKRKIREAGIKGISTSNLIMQTRHIRARDRTETLNAMMESGEIERFTAKPARGSSATIFRIAPKI